MIVPIAVIWHTAAIYISLVLSLRFFGRRLLGQLTALDLVIIAVLGSAVETSMVAGNTSLGAGLASAVTLLTLDRVVSEVFRHSKALRQLVGGVPVLLVHNGQFLEENMRRAGLTEADVLTAMRERGVSDLSNVKLAVLEIDGGVNVVTINIPFLTGTGAVRK